MCIDRSNAVWKKDKMSESKATYQCAADVIDRWRDNVLSGQPPVMYPVGDGDFRRLEVGPGLVTLIGGAPGVGKTAFTMQCVIDALRLTPSLRALVCNVEMSPSVLLDRQLARLSGIDLTAIRYRKLEARHADRVERGISTLEAIADRLCFVRPPFHLGTIATAADDFDAGLLVLDYIQRIPPPEQQDTHRGTVNATMNYLRQFAETGVAVIVVSAVGRSRDHQGRNTYSGDVLNLASFRESSELEFGADSAFILCQGEADDDESVVLKHLKDRHGALDDIEAVFDRAHQSFIVAGSMPSNSQSKQLTAQLQAMWKNAVPAPEGEEAEQDG
jgi:replicative DNA helicase